MSNAHLPVLYHEVIQSLQPKAGGRYVDCTLGGGGHAWGILQNSTPDGLLLGLDVDPQAIRIAQEKLAVFDRRVILMQVSYQNLAIVLVQVEWSKVDGIILDLGISSMQIDTPERGFSFQHDGPLDMRFDPNNPESAAELVNHLSEAELAKLIHLYGEEPASRKIARAIVNKRPIYTTSELAEIVLLAVGQSGSHSKRDRSGNKGRSVDIKKHRIHPATRTFQALRIAVNQELKALEYVLPHAVEALLIGGRLVVISFHSLEDRIVKNYFRQESKDCICPSGQPVCTCGHKAKVKLITRKPIQSALKEIEQNPRSRSAKLRVVEKILNS